MDRRTFLMGASLTGLAAVAPWGARAAAKPKVGLVMKSLANEFFKTMQEGAEAHAAQRGDLELIAVGIQSETDIDGQIAAVENLITRGVDAMVVAPADSRALLPPVVRAVKSGIKVVNIDVAFNKPSMQRAGVDIVFVGPDNRAGARMSGNVLGKMLGQGGKVAIIEGNPGAENGVQRRLGFMDAIRDGHLNLLDSRTAHWETEEANSVFTDMLTAHPDIQGVMAANDAMALGVAQAIDASRRPNVRIASFDNIAAIKPLLRNGQVVATVNQFGSQLASAGIDTAMHELAGQTLTGWIKTPLMLVTAQNVG